MRRTAIILTLDGARETRSLRRLPAEQQWDGNALVNFKGLPWDYVGTRKRKCPLYTAARVPLLPDSATLEQVAKAAGTAAAEAIAASTPKPNNNDEAGRTAQPQAHRAHPRARPLEQRLVWRMSPWRSRTQTKQGKAGPGPQHEGQSEHACY